MCSYIGKSAIARMFFPNNCANFWLKAWTSCISFKMRSCPITTFSECIKEYLFSHRRIIVKNLEHIPPDSRPLVYCCTNWNGYASIFRYPTKVLRRLWFLWVPGSSWGFPQCPWSLFEVPKKFSLNLWDALGLRVSQVLFSTLVHMALWITNIWVFQILFGSFSVLNSVSWFFMGKIKASGLKTIAALNLDWFTSTWAIVSLFTLIP